ncbi:MAG: GAF domain-containing protein [Thermoflexales bacterium]|nr:GAF domain-containing protein [Thermoflexales bacterium]
MNELASTIRKHMATLAGEYSQHLQEIEEYAQLPAQIQQELAWRDLEQVAACLESGDSAVLMRPVQEQVEPSLPLEASLKARACLEKLIMPLATDAETSSFLWRGFAQARDAAFSQAIHELKQREQALKAQQASLRQVLDINPDFIFIRDRQGRFVLANQAVAQGYGATVDELIGKTDADLGRSLEEVERLLHDDLEVMDSLQEKFIPEIKIVEPDGNVRWIQTMKRPLVDEDGVARTILGVSSDITRRKQLEQAIQESLERRGREVQTSTEVAQEIAVAPALDELYQSVVTLIKERFDYYHAQIFQYEPALDAVVLVTSYGEAGQRLLGRGHRLPMGRGVVGTAAATGQSILATDVSKDKDWRPNPDLPDTKGELAVPIKLRERVLGILDVQSDRAGALSQDDQLLLEGLCGQIAIAIESTRLRQDMEGRLRELNEMYRTTSREGWQSFRETGQMPDGYLFDRLDIHPRTAAELWTAEGTLAAAQNVFVPPTPSEAGKGGTAAAPLSVHGEVIGILGVHDDPRQPMSEDELSLVEQVSEQVAQALESARLSEQTRRALEETRLLYQVSTALTEARTFEDVLEALRQHPLLKAADRNVSINLFDRPWASDDAPSESTPEWSTPAAYWSTLPPQAASAAYPLKSFPSIHELVKPDQSTVISAIDDDPRLDENLRALYTQRFLAQSALFVPLVAGGRLIGYVNAVYSKTTEFSEAEIRWLMNMAGPAAVTVQSIRQLEETQRRARQEQVLREITTMISASQEFLAASLPDINRYLQELVPVDVLILATHAPGDSEYTLLAVSDPLSSGLFEQRKRYSTQYSAIGWVATRSQTRLDPDLREQRYFKEDAQLVSEGLASRLILPLKVGSGVIGTLGLFSTRPGAFAQGHIMLLEPLADQIALALDRVHLLEETRAALAETEATHRRYLREQWEQFLSGTIERSLGFVDGPSGLAPATTPPITDQVPKDTILSIPLKVRGEAIGTLDLYDQDTSRTWDADEVALAEVLADQTAQALERARLFEDTQSRAQREHMIGEIASKIRASVDMDAVLRTSTQEIAQALNLSRARIRLGTQPEGDTLKTE